MAEPLGISAFEGQLEFGGVKKEPDEGWQRGRRESSDVVKLRKERVLKGEWQHVAGCTEEKIKWEAILYI